MKKIIFFIYFLTFFNLSFADILKKVPVSDFAKADIQLLLNGAYAPVDGFFKEADYHSCLDHMQLLDGTFWPLPITLRVNQQIANQLSIGETIYLVDDTNHPLATLVVEEVYAPNKEKEILSLFNTLDSSHPFIADLMKTSDLYVAGKVKQVHSPQKEEFQEFVLSPSQIKKWKHDHQIETLIGFQTRNPLHRAHVETIRNCWHQLDNLDNKALLLHPTCGPTQPGDIPASVRLGCYQALLPRLEDMQVKLSLLPLPMRMAGPKEALLHAVIRKNYGCTHFIVGRDHAGPSAKKIDGSSYFHPQSSFLTAKKFEEKLGIHILPCEEFVFVEELQDYKQKKSLDASWTIKEISGTKLRQLLKDKQEIPDWFSYPEVIEILKNYYHSKNGLCVYIVGLPASGKSTLAKVLKERLEKETNYSKNIILLDADALRKNIGQELGFSKEHRSINVRRIGYVASKIVEAGGICIVSNIAPFEEDRAFNRKQISQYGPYIEVFVDTPVEICAERDPKDLYKNAKEGLVANMTGISQTFEKPQHPEYILNSSNFETVIDEILSYAQ